MNHRLWQIAFLWSAITLVPYFVEAPSLEKYQHGPDSQRQPDVPRGTVT